MTNSQTLGTIETAVNGITEAMPFLQKYDITFLCPPPILRGF